MMEPTAQLQADAPIYELIKTYSTDKPSVVPIFDGDKFKGYDVLVIKTYVNGAVSKTDRAKYAITGEKIGGSAIIE